MKSIEALIKLYKAEPEKLEKSRESLKPIIMKYLIEKILSAKVYAKHTAIKGKKSSGKEDDGGYKNWKAIGPVKGMSPYD